MISIDEAIAHAREVASEQKRRSGICIQNNSECDKFSACLKCSKEHEQLAEWLEDYKRIKMLIPIEQALKNEYNKAIDDFAENISLEISESLIWGMIADCFKYKNLNDTSDKIVDYVINAANEIAEHLKVGGNS